ncbi:class I SAM-dependent methyltransferase [Neptunicoccus sediminis]|uniref:class I SAM-dependent methyltransferase n=1 Tax=Neptunicoccus sediminis TaxID=1892596 RepID=UPI0009F5FE4C|nr:class I SAM-dependent methyltransferase [Neptunicoccus sediminis]
MSIYDGGYDDGYRACPCFWGKEVGSLITKFLEENEIEGSRILDAGCGEGKNAVALAKLGADVTAIDCSEVALQNAKNAFGGNSVHWQCSDVRNLKAGGKPFDVVVAYGLLHCMQSADEIASVVHRLQELTEVDGWNIICAFNDRQHDLSAHPGFDPCLVPHSTYLRHYQGWEVTFSSDEDLHESHPHNNIPHVHSMTRLIARKVKR